MGGEKLAVSLCMVLQLGSPPRGRGKDRTGFVRGDGDRITPA